MQTKRPVLSGRILCIACAAYTLGIAVYALFNPPIAALFAAISVFVIAAAFKKLPHLFSVIIACLAFSGGILQFQLLQSADNRFAEKYTGRYVTVTGRITGISLADDGRQNIIVAADSFTALNETENTDIYISLYTDTEKSFSVGDTISFSDIFAPPKRSSIHSFDYELYLHTKNISASFSVASDKISVTPGRPSFTDKIKFFSAALSDKLRSSVGGEESEVAAAILLGDKSGFSDELTQTFTRSGISHIVAVSGMHLSILMSFFFLIAGKTRLHYKIRNIFGILIVLCYMAITGFSPSVTRAGIMLICTLAAAILDRKEDLITSFFLSAAIILSLNPYTIYSASFLLSYSALAGILIFTKPLTEKLPHFIPHNIKLTVATSFSASILTLPILAYMFNGISILSLMTNILVVPLVNIIFIASLVTLVLSFIYAPLGVIAGFVPKLMIKFILFVAKTVSAIPFSYLNVKTPTVTGIICFTILVVLFYFLITGKKTGKVGALAFPAVICITSVSVIISSLTCSVTFFDIGQGDCALIKAPGNRAYLIDTGAYGSTTLSALRSVGLNHIDVIFISHADKDHSGALSDIVNNIPTEKVVFPRYDVMGEKLTELAETAVNAGANVEFADSYHSYKLSGITADAVWPARNLLPYDENSGSLVLRMNIKGNSFLFTGDIDEAAESAIIKSREIIDSDVLKVSHHGSSDASTDLFLEKVCADYAVISAGKNNQYGHPSEDTLARLEESGSRILRTDESGDIKFAIDLFGNMRVNYETD